MADYITACEKSLRRKVQEFQKGNPSLNRNNMTRSNREGMHDMFSNKQINILKPRFSAEALFTNTKSECTYCKKGHWRDECKTYKTLEARKRKLKGCCFRCLNEGHSARECRSNKACVYCGEFHKHHRSLCAKRFKSKCKKELTYRKNFLMKKNLLRKMSWCLLEKVFLCRQQRLAKKHKGFKIAENTPFIG